MNLPDVYPGEVQAYYARRCIDMNPDEPKMTLLQAAKEKWTKETRAAIRTQLLNAIRAKEPEAIENAVVWILENTN